MMHKRLLIIPARIGSKRIKKKNIKNFLGKPIINYSIETAKRSKLFHTIHVSSDSQIILKKVRKFSNSIS
jgi:N-acylneuraminate cytidylyltransferase